MDSKTTIQNLFDPAKRQFTIPSYQRAFSWTKEQLEPFWHDLNDYRQNWPQAESQRTRTSYYLGNIILEDLNGNDQQFAVIDGQQRLTTLVIQMACVVAVLRQRGDDEEWVEELSGRYLKFRGRAKFQTVHYDNNFFVDSIINSTDGGKASTKSKHRMQDAKAYFTAVLDSLSSEEIKAVVEVAEQAVVTTYVVENKQEAAQIFIFQNDRGRDLTEMEKLKAFFVYLVQLRSDNSEDHIKYLEKIFTTIYESIECLTGVSEDEVLAYYARAFYFGYGVDSIRQRVDKELKAIKSSEEQIDWIRTFSRGLEEAFQNTVMIQQSADPCLKDLFYLNRMASCYPFLLKAFKFVPDDCDRRRVFRLLETIIFRVKLLNSKANIETRLDPHLTKFVGDVAGLIASVKQEFKQNWWWYSYWGDVQVKKAAQADFFYNSPVDNYLLWKYEEHLRQGGQRGYSAFISFDQLKSEELEHISPQTPTNGEPVAAGYDEYSEEFRERFLNCVGNLMLISKSHNRSIGNKPFGEKLSSYRSNVALSQHLEIESFVGDVVPPRWGKDAIQARANKIIGFAIGRWVEIDA